MQKVLVLYDHWNQRSLVFDKLLEEYCGSLSLYSGSQLMCCKCCILGNYFCRAPLLFFEGKWSVEKELSVELSPWLFWIIISGLWPPYWNQAIWSTWLEHSWGSWVGTVQLVPFVLINYLWKLCDHIKIQWSAEEHNFVYWFYSFYCSILFFCFFVCFWVLGLIITGVTVDRVVIISELTLVLIVVAIADIIFSPAVRVIVWFLFVLFKRNFWVYRLLIYVLYSHLNSSSVRHLLGRDLSKSRFQFWRFYCFKLIKLSFESFLLFIVDANRDIWFLQTFVGPYCLINFLRASLWFHHSNEFCGLSN